ncbi:MAG: GNAT family N-acetyltransferase [bacterium]
MFRIRRIYDDVLPINMQAIVRVQAILRSQFAFLGSGEIRRIPEQLRNPLKYRFLSILFVAENQREEVEGFALVSHEPELGFCFLDFISTRKRLTGKGIGSALYERVRQEAHALNTIGVFFECLPDDPKLCRDPQTLRENARRLKFYERYGATPIVNTAYETPVGEDKDNPPYLVYDNLGLGNPLSCVHARNIVRAILERKYADVCPREYVDMVVESFKDDPVQLRKPRYRKKESPITITRMIPTDKRIALVINDKHSIHHVRERGYVESPVRINVILKELDKTLLFEKIPVRHFSEKYVKSVHDQGFVNYLKKICTLLEPSKSIYPYVFPIRNAAHPPKELPVRAGYYCIDTFTPLNGNAYEAAKGSVDCTLTAASQILKGRRIAYALVRPPGHHAERSAFGGFCYFNSGAIAAQYLSAYGKVAILDIDYHHGNGQQDIFYERSDVLTISIHGHPRFAYPYFSGFAEERGDGEGERFNCNFPLPEKLDGKRYIEVLEKSLRIIRRFKPAFLIVALGLDTANGDPTGTWSLKANDFEANGRLIGALRLPTLVAQEGGYNTRNLGINVRRFLTGLWYGIMAGL